MENIIEIYNNEVDSLVHLYKTKGGHYVLQQDC